MATYNGEKYLSEQLDSLAKQSLAPFELVACDDGSTDATVSILEEFAKTAPFPVRICRNEDKLGFADNFLKAASLCRGDWVAFCDQDDVWLPRKIDRVSHVIELDDGHELAWITHASIIATETLAPTGRFFPAFKRDIRLKRESQFAFFGSVGFSTIFRAQLIRDIRHQLRPRIYWPSFGGPPGHDLWIGMLANVLGDMMCISEPLAIWRRHGTALTSTPERSNLVSEMARAAFATNSYPYVFRAEMAEETATCFRAISLGARDNAVSTRFAEAADRFDCLGQRLRKRGQLYETKSIIARLGIAIRLVGMNAYFGPRFHSLGWKASLKDIAWAFGAIEFCRGAWRA